MEAALCNAINKKLIDYLMLFPFPYIDILREQISACQITNEWYSDCYIIHFHRKGNTRQLPLWLPTISQGCQVLKENGPLSCQLYIESGYITQFEVVDMGMNKIDWEYLWSHKPIFDVEYDLTTIINYLTTEKLRILKTRVMQQLVYLNMNSCTGNHTVGLWNCNILELNLQHSEHDFRMEIYVTEKESHRYLVKSDDNNLAVECSIICLQDGLIIG